MRQEETTFENLLSGTDLVLDFLFFHNCFRSMFFDLKTGKGFGCLFALAKLLLTNLATSDK